MHLSRAVPGVDVYVVGEVVTQQYKSTCVGLNKITSDRACVTQVALNQLFCLLAAATAHWMPLDAL